RERREEFLRDDVFGNIEVRQAVPEFRFRQGREAFFGQPIFVDRQLCQVRETGPRDGGHPVISDPTVSELESLEVRKMRRASKLLSAPRADLIVVEVEFGDVFQDRRLSERLQAAGRHADAPQTKVFEVPTGRSNLANSFVPN